MNAENPVQIDLFGASATRTKDTRLAEHIGGSGASRTSLGSQAGSVGGCALAPGRDVAQRATRRRRVSQSRAVSGQPVRVRAAELVPVDRARGDNVGAAVIGVV
jgi:hypothetical protein